MNQYYYHLMTTTKQEIKLRDITLTPQASLRGWQMKYSNQYERFRTSSAWSIIELGNHPTTPLSRGYIVFDPTRLEPSVLETSDPDYALRRAAALDDSSEGIFDGTERTVILRRLAGNL